MSQISNQLTSGTKFFNKLKSKISNITYQSLAASVLKNVKYNKKFLGKIPLSQELRESADLGLPLTHKNSGHEISKIFEKIAQKVKDQL